MFATRQQPRPTCWNTSLIRPPLLSSEAARVLKHRADEFYAVAPNRFSLTAEPHVGVWGLGFLPRAWAESYVQHRFGVDYRSIRPFSWRRFQQALQSFGGEARADVLRPGPKERVGFSATKLWAARAYEALLRVPVVNLLVRRTAPAFEAWARKARRHAMIQAMRLLCSQDKPSYLIQGPGDLRPEWFAEAQIVGITAGASTPDYVIDEVEQALDGL